MTHFLTEACHDSRYIWVSWRERHESALQIAARIQAMARALAEVEPAYGELWPFVAARAIVPDKDPGPVLTMTEADLGDLIDRYCRFDKQPAAPSPPSEDGYSIVLGNNRSSRHPQALDMSIKTGIKNTKAYNSATVNSFYWTGKKLWHNEVCPRTVLKIMIKCFDADLAAIYGLILFPPPPSGGRIPPSRSQLWMYWTRPGVEPHKMYTEMEPAPETFPWLDGTLSVWP